MTLNDMKLKAKSGMQSGASIAADVNGFRVSCRALIVRRGMREHARISWAVDGEGAVKENRIREIFNLKTLEK